MLKAVVNQVRGQKSPKVAWTEPQQEEGRAREGRKVLAGRDVGSGAHSGPQVAFTVVHVTWWGPMVGQGGT